MGEGKRAMAKGLFTIAPEGGRGKKKGGGKKRTTGPVFVLLKESSRRGEGQLLKETAPKSCVAYQGIEEAKPTEKG